MIEIIKKRINRLEYEICRLQVCYDAGNYDHMKDVFFEMKLLLETKLNNYQNDLAKYEKAAFKKQNQKNLDITGQ